MKNPAEIAGTRYKNEKLMSRMQKTDGTSRCFAQSENIKRQSLYYRYDRMLITVLTTNLGDEEICTRYGVRIADRMNETFDAIVFKGTSYRGRKQRPR